MAQHDYSIANQGFPAFRSDLNNALSAIATTNSGATAPTTTFAHQLWIDTSANPSVLKIRNADNDAWISVADLNQTSDAVTKVYGVSGVDNLFTVAQTFRAASAVRSEAASTQDAVVLAGRAGGTSSYAVTLTPTTLSANRTLTLPNVTDTLATIGTAQTFTAAQTFRAANSVRAEAATTQDAVVLAGRAGGTNSYAVTLTPATLASNTTLTLPNVTSTVAILGTAQTFTASQRGTVTTDNDGSFDMNVTNNFSCTPTGNFTLTFTNITAGQSGFILLVNNSNYTISAAATTKVQTGALATISATGTYLLSYWSNGTNVYVTHSGAMA